MKKRTSMYLILCFMVGVMLFGFSGCAGKQMLTPDEIKLELADLGWSMGNQFRTSQKPETVADAIKNTERILGTENLLLSQDLINAGIKWYLMNNPEYSLYYTMGKSILRLMGVKLPTVDILKESGLDLSQFKLEYITVFLENWCKGLKGEVAGIYPTLVTIHTGG